jgi:hypothetical protein
MVRRRRYFQTIRQSDFRMVPLFVNQFSEWCRYSSNGFPYGAAAPRFSDHSSI